MKEWPIEWPSFEEEFFQYCFGLSAKGVCESSEAELINLWNQLHGVWCGYIQLKNESDISEALEEEVDLWSFLCQIFLRPGWETNRGFF